MGKDDDNAANETTEKGNDYGSTKKRSGFFNRCFVVVLAIVSIGVGCTIVHLLLQVEEHDEDETNVVQAQDLLLQRYYYQDPDKWCKHVVDSHKLEEVEIPKKVLALSTLLTWADYNCTTVTGFLLEPEDKHEDVGGGYFVREVSREKVVVPNLEEDLESNLQSMKQALASLSGPQKICQQLQWSHGVAIGMDWGTMEEVPSKMKKWNELKCPKNLRRRMPEGWKRTATSKYVMERCKAIQDQYELEGTSLEGARGTLTSTPRDFWISAACSFRFTEEPPLAEPMLDCTRNSNGQNLPRADLKTMPFVAVCVAATSRGTHFKVGDDLSDLALFAYLLPSFTRTAECGFRYVVSLAFDKGDPFYDSAAGQQEIQDWFKVNVQRKLFEVGITCVLVLTSCENKDKIPGPAFEAMTQAAFKMGAEYIYRVNDDTEFMVPWTRKFVDTLQGMGSPFGVVGPSSHNTDDRILTHDFVHRTHLQIFHTYYPPQLNDWYMDDWISRVYGSQRTRMAKSVPVHHHTNKHGQRYQPDRSHARYVDGLVKKGHEVIVDWVEHHNLTASILEQIKQDRTNGAPYATI